VDRISCAGGQTTQDTADVGFDFWQFRSRCALIAMVRIAVRTPSNWVPTDASGKHRIDISSTLPAMPEVLISPATPV
jgi:glucose dehydrogenase